MNANSRVVTLILSLFFYSTTQAQILSESLMQHPWKAQWIAAKYAPPKEYGVYKFRKNFELTAKPASFVVHVSADNRYKLFVNEQLVSLGPARGDLYFWNFETVDIASYLQAGKNTIAALVWNDGKQKPEAQITYMTGFILQGNSGAEEIVNTNATWKSIKDSSYAPLETHVPGYYVAGPGEVVQMKDHVKGWQQINYDDSKWQSSRSIGSGLTKDAARDSRGWMLVPSPLPPMELKMQRLSALRKTEGIPAPVNFPAVKAAFTIPANTTATLLLDQGFLTNAYPSLLFSKGNNAGISLSYAEALYSKGNEKTKSGRGKGNRNDVDGKIFIGKIDSIVADGSDGQQYTCLWWRTYRYIQLRVTTKDEALVIDDIYGTFTGYPFVQKTSFHSGNAVDDKILEIGWRTARLCAFETYMDCPFYEQLQYIGDARIQALVTLYNTSDDRLVRNALTLMDHSRIAEGITLSRYPTDLQQQIPTFSLWWIGMLHDYWMYRPDAIFIKDKLPGERQVLNFFQHYQTADGSLKDVPYWIFSDWVEHRRGWDYGQAPIGKSGYSAVLDLQLMWTYKVAAEMEAAIGFMDYAKLYNRKAAQLKQTIQKKYWDKTRLLYADTEDKDLFSQHTNSLAVLAGMITRKEATALGEKLLSDTSMAQASIYFKYYLHQALIKAGLGNDYSKWLGKWQENIDLGMTTWAEMSDVSGTRSDCHAWGSSPNIEFYRTILGIDSDAPGFAKVKIEPHLGKLKNVSGSMPHPNGIISTSYRNENNKWTVEISLPVNTAGYLVWKGKTLLLKSGVNKFNF
ncbi:alpha-L-rhamnosidase C-terminal domain-containing protein [Ferruginibacter paludis]|uniref:alpha-L-rhamnosidase-related protein n=1 Tax=Ferruginibacter paludis TaxID=1310417 RepID=UPI0025B29BF2|nr:alpha-L-rhamnosidase C-terminal domain-containing protein [Ferruginibacter paludis]MDN3657609.1 alpha-L-rhamnosidase C-terminal domain-containing protein [Ferruginibacter paludis]